MRLTLALARDVLHATLVKFDFFDFVVACLVLGDCFVSRAEAEENELVRVNEEVLVQIYCFILVEFCL